MIKVPEILIPYVNFDDGEIVAVDLPSELIPDFEKFKKQYEILKSEPLTDY